MKKSLLTKVMALAMAAVMLFSFNTTSQAAAKKNKYFGIRKLQLNIKAVHERIALIISIGNSTERLSKINAITDTQKRVYKNHIVVFGLSPRINFQLCEKS